MSKNNLYPGCPKCSEKKVNTRVYGELIQAYCLICGSEGPPINWGQDPNYRPLSKGKLLSIGSAKAYKAWRDKDNDYIPLKDLILN